MKIELPLAALCLGMAFLGACSKSPESSGKKAPVAETPTAVAPDPSLPEKTVVITGNDQMKFDVVAIEAKPGQKVTVTLKNLGTMPKMSMGHNFVLLPKTIEPAAFIEASQTHMGSEFIAPELKNKVLAHTKLLGPGESDTVSFAAPRIPGDYTYLCSFPGHFAIGMKGTLSVK